MTQTPIQFDDSLYDTAINGHAYMRYCNKKFKPQGCDQSYDRIVQPGDVWFVKTDFVFEFYNALRASGTSCPINIVLQYSDYSMTAEIIQNRPACIQKVFGSHNEFISDASVPIPVGLSPPPPHGHGAPLPDDIRKVNTRQEREKLLYVNFRPYTYPEERQPLYDYFHKIGTTKDYTVEEPQDVHSFDRYLNQLINHKFCLCPRGHGVESHRMWESLYARTIPIVKRHVVHRNWQELPILWIDDWNVINPDFLNEQYEIMSKKQYDYSKLDASWWGKEFRKGL